MQVSPGAAGQPDNRVIYSIPGGHFLRKITGGGRAWWVQYTPPNWRGVQPNESAADRAIRGVGDVVFFGGKVQVAATYVARTADQWHWVPLETRRFEDTVGNSPATLPEGTYEIEVVGKPGGAGDTDYVPHRILLSNIPASNRNFFFRADESVKFRFGAAYNPTTRVLTYTTSLRGAGNSQATVLTSIKAIGQA